MLRIAIIFIIALLATTTGCDRDDSPSAEPPADTDEDTKQRSLTTDDEVDDVYQSLGRTMVARPFETLNKFVKLGCYCDYDGQGYEGEEECLSDRALVDEKFSDAADCAAASAVALEQPAPEGTQQTVNCLSELVDEIDRCIDEIADSYDDRCSDDAEQAYSQCFMELNEVMQRGYMMCGGDTIDDAIVDWFEDLGHQLQRDECFQPLQQLQLQE